MAEMRKYDDREILSHVDHTLLKPTATAADIDKIIDEGIRYQTASVCIPPSFVAHAAAYAKGRVKICTVIGFPNGYNTTAVKVYETEDAVNNGADEIDMVINLGDLKAGNYDGKRRGLYQDLHRLFHGRRNLCGHRAVCAPCPRHPHQGGGRHPKRGGRRAFSRPRRRPPRHQFADPHALRE